MAFPFIILGLYLLTDFYAFPAIKKVLGKKTWVKWTYWGINILFIVGLISMIIAIMGGMRVRSATTSWFFTFFITWWVPKIIIATVMLLEDIVRGGKWLYRFFQNPPTQNTFTPPETIAKKTISRSKFISQSAIVLAGIPFAFMMNGIFRGRYQFTLHKHKVPIVGLPKSFEGFTITQISDIHVGSFDDKEAVQRGIDLIMDQQSDMVCFSGDLVNNNISELQGFEDIFSQITAPAGVYSVLGNHDYGRYDNTLSREGRRHHMERMVKAHEGLGWRLLRNEHDFLVKGEDRMAIVGVENWGKGFGENGDLDKAAKGTEAADVRILLSHDPSHWDEKVRPHALNFDLTMSGHTHGMQFGLEIPALKIKWSPASWRYKQWAGLYQDEDKKQSIYVNRGFGHLGYMGRSGILPEVTVLELVKAEA